MRERWRMISRWVSGLIQRRDPVPLQLRSEPSSDWQKAGAWAGAQVLAGMAPPGQARVDFIRSISCVLLGWIWNRHRKSTEFSQLGGGTISTSCGKREGGFFFPKDHPELPTNHPRTCRQKPVYLHGSALHRLPNADPPGCGLSNHYPALLHEVRNSLQLLHLRCILHALPRRSKSGSGKRSSSRIESLAWTCGTYSGVRCILWPRTPVAASRREFD
ncbi:hypothetical protein BJX63DRAFT_157321 [Aspergillus granulosus]|uniref:Uncharacterized protein n=1 Tax=Aspergillus granulosus TaxID=176169 RepID=A0ABR4HK96_9EURO